MAWKIPKLSDWDISSVNQMFEDALGKIGINLKSSSKHRRRERSFFDFSWKIWLAGGLFCLLIWAFFWQGFFSTPDPVGTRGSIAFEVRPGMTSREIGAELSERGIIKSEYRFWILAKMNGFEEKFKTGRYVFRSNMEPKDVMQRLMAGATATVQFTIPEGYDIEQIAKRLAGEGKVDEKIFLAKAKHYAPYDYIKKDARARYYAEGFLFPDTYEIAVGADADAILEMMSKNFDERLTEEMRNRAKEMNLSVYDLIILASLVEREARYEEDRAMIAQVFLKRLKIGMPLQSDATLQYLMHAPKEDVTIEDTKIDSPYNSYQHDGLPPGPIANPGIASIKAVLWPADTEYLYFVADREGHNHYSSTYAEHLALVEKVR